MAGGGVLDENNCYICRLELRYGVMVALQILVLSAQVRILVPQLSFFTGHIPGPLRLRSKRIFLNPSHFVTAPFRGKPAPASLRRASPLLRCLRHLAAAPPRRLCGPCGSRFPILPGQNPGPGRSANADFLYGAYPRTPAALKSLFDFALQSPATAPVL